MRRVDVRGHLAQVTADVHQALHNDPVLSRLSDPMLTASQYADALGVFCATFHQIEDARAHMQVHPRLTLSDECRALARDLGPAPRTSLHNAPLRLEDGHMVLGALYVAHGAAFGRNTMRKTVRTCLPHHSHAFMSLRPCPDTWRALLHTLQREGQSAGGLDRIEAGAVRAFEHVATLSCLVAEGRRASVCCTPA